HTSSTPLPSPTRRRPVASPKCPPPTPPPPPPPFMRCCLSLTALLLSCLPATAAGGRVTLEDDVLPILTRAGCNAGACHGKQRGQNGFQLSLLAFDADFDFAALTQEARGRRIFPAAPEQSLLLRKASAQVPHGGGRRLTPGDGRYEVLRDWI